jgi:hypothetical protein
VGTARPRSSWERGAGGVVRLNLWGVLTFDRGGEPRLDGRPIPELAGFAGGPVVLTLAKVCGYTMAGGEICTMPPGHWPERNHCNLLEL